MELNRKLIIIALTILLFLGIIVGIVLKTNNSGYSDKGKEVAINEEIDNKDEEQLEVLIEEKVDIIDINSKTRPYAIVVNNTAVAVKVQEGLNKAYLVYEMPTEGNTSRLLAFYKDIDEELVVGTIRSARHNFVDYALESDAIFCCYGASHYAHDQLERGIVDHFQGLFGGPFYRNNPEDLALEHTAYTNISDLNKALETKKFRTTSDDTILLNYDVSDVDLSSASNVKKANTVTIPYGSSYYKSSFKYDEKTNMYTRYQKGKKCVDYNTNETITTKNIIVQKVKYKMCDDNYYWDLETIGTGEGYYITNGYAVPIKWSKSNRSAKTKYTYKSGTVIDGQDVGGQEISVSDGRTWIELQTTKQKLTIE